ESNFQTDAVGDKGTSIGGWQWRNSRATALKNFAEHRGTDWRDLDTQVDFLVHELNTTERRAARALAASRDVDEATTAFMHFERPHGDLPGNPERRHNSKRRLRSARALAQEPAGADGRGDGATAGAQALVAPVEDSAQSPGNRAIDRAIGIGMVQPGATEL